MQADPLGLVDGASVYGYARQNPGRYVDPRGECAGICTGIVIAAGIGIRAVLADSAFWGAGAVVVGGAAVMSIPGDTPTTGDEVINEAQGICPDSGCPYEVSLSSVRMARRREILIIISRIGHPHDLKDGSFEDMYVDPITGCVYVGNKDGTGIGRLVGRI